MPRASGVANPPAAAATAAASSSKNASRNVGHSVPSCSAPAYQLFRPVTRSMTCGSDPIVAPPGFKAGGSASTSSRRSTSDASFSTQLAASRPIATHARTPLKGTSSGWKPLTQPVALNVERQCAGLTINPTAKRSRVASSRAVKDSTNHSKANSNVPSGKKYIDEEIVSLGDQSDGAVMPSPTKKLQICKGLSDASSIRKSSIRILGVKGAARPPTGKSSFANSTSADVIAATTGKSSFANSTPADVIAATTGKSSFANNTPAVVIAASTNKISDNASVPSLAQQSQPALPRPILQSDYNKKPSNVPIIANQASGLAGAKPSNVPPIMANQASGLAGAKPSNVPIMANQASGLAGAKPSNVPIMANQASGLAGMATPLITPKLEIRNMKDSSNTLSNPAYARALLIKQQEQLLQQYKLGSSQQQRQEQQLYIKGPALFENDDPPPVEPLGTRCQLCKLDIAFRPQGDPGRDANAPPVIAVLACHHVFHSRCIESVYRLAEPAECLACLEPGAAH